MPYRSFWERFRFPREALVNPAVNKTGIVDIAPESTRIRPTIAGRTLLPVAGAGLFASWAMGGSSGLLTVLVFAVLAVSVPRTWLPVRGLRLALPGRFECTVGELFRADLHVRNTSAFFRATDLILVAGDTHSEDPRPIGSISAVGKGQTSNHPIELRILDRGRQRKLSLLVIAKAPLNLVRVHLLYEIPVELWGLPRRGRWNSADPDDRGRLSQSAHEALRRAEEEFYGVRDWRAGEGTRRVHWRLSARRDELIVREYRAPAEPPIHLQLSTRVSDRGPWAEKDPGFERACSLVATLGEHFLRLGREVRFSVLRRERGRPMSFKGRRSLRALLLVLAEVRCTPGDPWADIQFVHPSRNAHAWNIVCFSGGGSRSITNKGDTWLLDVEDPDIDECFRRAAFPTTRRALHRV